MTDETIQETRQIREQIERGTKLRAGTTGKVYKIMNVEDGNVHIDAGIAPIRVEALASDIEQGRIEVVGTTGDSSSR